MMADMPYIRLRAQQRNTFQLYFCKINNSYDGMDGERTKRLQPTKDPPQAAPYKSRQDLPKRPASSPRVAKTARRSLTARLFSWSNSVVSAQNASQPRAAPLGSAVQRRMWELRSPLHHFLTHSNYPVHSKYHYWLGSQTLAP